MKWFSLTAGVLIATALLAGNAGAVQSGGSAVSGERDDIVLAWAWDVTGDHVDNIMLQEWADVNNNGEISGVNEVINWVQTGNPDCTQGTTPTYLACTFFTTAFSMNRLIIKNASGAHLAGKNLSVFVALENTLGQVIDSFLYGIKVERYPESQLGENLTAIRANMSHESYTWLAGQNHTLSFHGSSALAPSQFDATLARLRDLNADGDYADASESVNVLSLSNAVGCGAAAAHVSCRVDLTRQSATIVWRGGTADNIPGDYWLDWRWESGAGNELARFEAGIHMDAFLADQAVGTRGLVNQSYANLTTFGVPCASNCTEVGNVSINTTSFTTDCHGTGTDLCINGHTPNLVLDQSGQFILILGAIIALAWLSTRKGSPLALIGFFGSVALTFLLFTFFNTATQSRVANEALLGLAVMVMCLGPVYYVFNRRTDRERAFEEGEEDF